MYVIDVRNVNAAYPIGLNLLRTQGVVRPSRYGEVIELDAPVCTVYQKPAERLLFDHIRDANPFFHLFEALWMLAGRNDVAWLKQFNKRMEEFSDDGLVFHGAYGMRWRGHFSDNDPDAEGPRDQLIELADLITKDPSTRRAVIQMWDPAVDLGRNGKDLPCNVSAVFSARRGCLDMTVFCRSNDMLWGAYGANVVHLSMLQELLAGMSNQRLGVYRQVSVNFHGYTERLPLEVSRGVDPYTQGVVPVPIFDQFGEGDNWLDDVEKWVNWVEAYPNGEFAASFNHSWFGHVAVPMFFAWRAWKQGEFAKAYGHIDRVYAEDWRIAAKRYLERRDPALQGDSAEGT